MLDLHALPDDFQLNANADTERGTDVHTVTLGPYYLVDELGNYLVDELGNRLIAYDTENVYPQILHTLPDDFQLNAE